VYGSSDKNGAYPRTGKLEPQDLTATIFHLLGIGHEAFFPHPTGRPIRATEGQPIYPVLGSAPATSERTTPGGTLALVPEYSAAPLLNLGFEDAVPLSEVGAGKRLKGWQATPLLAAAGKSGFGAALADGAAGPQGGRRHAVLGYGLGGFPARGLVRTGDRVILAQEVRSPRAGKYTFSVHAGGGGSADEYRGYFLKHFTCRLIVFGYADAAKDPRRVRQYATVTFQPPFAEGGKGKSERFELPAVLRDQDGGAGQLGGGVGVAVVVEKTAAGDLNLAADAGRHRAWVRIDDCAITFVPRPRNDDVQV
jgi:hypothetical protein